tara:strand:- start:2179 stop:2958 length:780 start_codon:yes stop_codon:yes gene_type:complete
MKISVVSGGFDPLHSGHISYLNSAKKSGNFLIVLLNSDEWLNKKKGKFFLPFKERKLILENLKVVDEVMNFKDDDLNSCINGLIKIKKKYPKDEIIFCNGGDRTQSNIPEMSLEDIKFKFGVGGKIKRNSSSDILKNWNNESEKRIWGSFTNLLIDKHVKVKELIIDPGKGMSFQRHFHRNEIWFVSEGRCKVKHSKNKKNVKDYTLSKNDVFTVKTKEWHQIINTSDEVCKIIEIQYGDQVQESDIERLYYFNDKKIK